MSENTEIPVPSGIMTVAGGPVTVTETPSDTVSTGPGKHRPTPERPTHEQVAYDAYELYLGNSLAGEPNDKEDNWYEAETKLWRHYIHELDRLHQHVGETEN